MRCSLAATDCTVAYFPMMRTHIALTIIAVYKAVAKRLIVRLSYLQRSARTLL